MNPKLFFSTLLFLPVFYSCNQFSKEGESKDIRLAEFEKNELPGSPTETRDGKQKIPVGVLQQQPADTSTRVSLLQPAAHIDWDKKIIKTATVKLEVKDFKKYNESLHHTIRKYGGYIAQEQQNLADEKTESVFSIKVPVEQFEPLMNELPACDVKIMERMITSQDVTGEVIDTKSRLEAKKQVRLKYLDFLKASKNMEDVLKVQAEINDLQEEIEAAAGRIEFLSHQSAYSTINLSIYQPAPGFKPVDSSPSFLARVNNAFKTGADWIADLFIGLLSVWPLILIFTCALIVFKRMKFLKSVQ